MKLKYDKQADAIFIQLTDSPYAYGKDLDDVRRIDYDSAGNPRGVELLCLSEGVVTDRLPDRLAIEKLLDTKGIRIFAP